MPKKTLSLLLAIALLMGVGAPTAAMAMRVVSTSSSSQSVEEASPASVAAIGDSLYILDVDGVLQRMALATRAKEEVGKCIFTGYHTSAEDVEVYISMAEDANAPAIGRIFAWEGQLYGLCVATGRWLRLLDDGGAMNPQPMEPMLDTSALIQKEEDYSSALEPHSLFVQDGKLYYAAQGYGYTGSFYRMGQIDLTTGENKLFQTQNLTELAPWADGKLMARVFDEENAYNTQDGQIAKAQYGLFDPQADTFAPLGDLKTDGDMGGYTTMGICTQPETDTLYYMAGGRIMGLDTATGESRVSAYTGAGMFFGSSGSQVLSADGYYIRKTYNEVNAYALDSEAVKQGALRIFGEFGSDPHNSFLRAYPDIPVDVGENYTSSLEELTSAMVSGSDAYDVLLLNVSYMPVNRMQEKGYCMDLSQYPEIMDTVSQMYPKFVEPLMVDGKLFAVPVQMSAYTLGVNMETWTETLGLSEEELPKTFEEFLDFFANWEDDFGDDYGDIALLSSSPYREMLFNSIFQDYITYMQFKGEDLRFDTPVMRKLLTAFERNHFSDGESGATSYAWNDSSLFDTYHIVGQLDDNTWRKTSARPLPLTSDTEAVIGANISVLIINPKTTRLDQALLYVAHYLQNLNASAENITFFPQHNDPVEASYYAQNMKSTQETLEQQRALYEAADESEKASIQQTIQMIEENIAESEQYRYSASPEGIANYRENEYPLLFVNQMSAFLQSDTTELSKTLMQYLDGAIDQNQFIKEMDQRVRMMELESK